MVRSIDAPFVINLADAPAIGGPRGATFIQLEPDGVRWADTGVNVQVMQPGQPNGRYHSEPVQEDFLVLYGECIAIVGDEERPLRQWDFFHCPAGSAHSSEKVYCTDGAEVGEVDEVTGDDTQDIFDGIALATSALGQPLYLPAERVRAITDGQVHLSLSREAEGAMLHPIQRHEQPMNAWRRMYLAVRRLIRR